MKQAKYYHGLTSQFLVGEPPFYKRGKMLYQDKSGTCWEQEDVDNLQPWELEKLELHPYYDIEVGD